MRTGRLVLAAALAVAAVLLALLASDVGTTSDDLQRDDVRYAAGRTGADWRADTVLPLELLA